VAFFWTSSTLIKNGPAITCCQYSLFDHLRMTWRALQISQQIDEIAYVTSKYKVQAIYGEELDE
jgi:hypothetical protein